jgi:hypothetical protein
MPSKIGELMDVLGGIWKEAVLAQQRYTATRIYREGLRESKKTLV